MAAEPRIEPWPLRFALLTLASLGFALLAWWPMIATHPHTPELDGQYSLYQLEINRAILLLHKEFPLWNPYDCRGIPHWDFPESMGASPILLTTYWLPALHQYYLWNIVHCAAGFFGMWLLTRDDLRLSRIAAVAASTAWAFGAAHTAQYSTGHVMFVGFWNVPLLLFLWRRAEGSYGYAMGVGILLAWMIYDGGTYPVPFCVLFLAIEGALRLTSLRRARAIVASGLVTGLTAFLLAAPRLLPIAGQFSSHVRPNPYPDVDFMTRAANVRAMFLDRKTLWSLRLPGQQYVWNEYISYIGYAGVLLAFVGLAFAAVRRRWLVALALIVLALMLGHFGDYAPWTLLQKNVFPYTSMRVPSRFRFFLTALAAIFAAIAIDEAPPVAARLFGRSLGKATRAGLVGLALLGTGDVMAFGYEMLSTRFAAAPAREVTASPRFYYGGRGLTPSYLDQPRQNRAWLGCRAVSWAFYENAPVWSGDVPQARAAGDGVTVEDVRRSANRFSFTAKLDAPGRVRLNSAYGDGWRTDVGAVVNDGDLLAVDLPAGDHRVHIRYWPKNLTLGIALALAGALGIAAFALRRTLTRRLRRPA